MVRCGVPAKGPGRLNASVFAVIQTQAPLRSTQLQVNKSHGVIAFHTHRRSHSDHISLMFHTLCPRSYKN